MGRGWCVVVEECEDSLVGCTIGKAHNEIWLRLWASQSSRLRNAQTANSYARFAVAAACVSYASVRRFFPSSTAPHGPPNRFTERKV